MSVAVDDPRSASASDGDDVVEQVRAVARRAQVASRRLATATRATKDAALHAMADALVGASARIVDANAHDLERGRAQQMAPGLLDRLALTDARIGAIADALRELAALPDPVGEVVRGQTLPNGLRLRQLRVPMGVVGMIYEARPNVTVDAAGLALKSGNAVVLRGARPRPRATRPSSRCCGTRSRASVCRATWCRPSTRGAARVPLRSCTRAASSTCSCRGAART